MFRLASGEILSAGSSNCDTFYKLSGSEEDWLCIFLFERTLPNLHVCRLSKSADSEGTYNYIILDTYSDGSRISQNRVHQLRPVADPGIPRAGVDDFAKFPQKMHEIERIWARGGASLAPPLRSANGYLCLCLMNLIAYFQMCGKEMNGNTLTVALVNP